MAFKKGNTYANTYKRNIVLELISKLPNASTMALSRMLFKTYPLDFDSIEQARGLVRYYRNEHNRSSRTIIAGFRTEKTKKQFMMKLPESDYQKCEPFIIPKGQK